MQNVYIDLPHVMVARTAGIDRNEDIMTSLCQPMY